MCLGSGRRCVKAVVSLPRGRGFQVGFQVHCLLARWDEVATQCNCHTPWALPLHLPLPSLAQPHSRFSPDFPIHRQTTRKSVEQTGRRGTI